MDFVFYKIEYNFYDFRYLKLEFLLRGNICISRKFEYTTFEINKYLKCVCVFCLYKSAMF